MTQFRERISTLVEDLGAANDIIGIPAPALAETLVRSGLNRGQYMKVLGDSWKFQIVPFDSRAAIEAAELIAAIKTSGEKWDTWAKIKFDIQIVAIAKAEGVTLIFSDDRDIEAYAKRFNIRVMRICDLPAAPAASETTPQNNAKVGAQMSLALESSSAVSTEPTPLPQTDEASNKLSPVTKNNESSAKINAGDQLPTNSPPSSATEVSRASRTRSRSAGEAAPSETEPPKKAKKSDIKGD